MATIRAIIAFIKNWKSIILALLFCVLILMLGIQTYRIQNIKLEAEKDKVAAYEAMIKAQKAHQQRLEKIAHDTGKIAQQIRSLNLDKERCQNDEYYKVANDIVKRFND